MTRRLECDVCGLAAGDLPDEVDPHAVFETTSSGTYCQPDVPEEDR